MYYTFTTCPCHVAHSTAQNSCDDNSCSTISMALQRIQRSLSKDVIFVVGTHQPRTKHCSYFLQLLQSHVSCFQDRVKPLTWFLKALNTESEGLSM